jgi:hypothetical protein
MKIFRYLNFAGALAISYALGCVPWNGDPGQIASVLCLIFLVALTCVRLHDSRSF